MWELFWFPRKGTANFYGTCHPLDLGSARMPPYAVFGERAFPERIITLAELVQNEIAVTFLIFPWQIAFIACLFKTL